MSGGLEKASNGAGKAMRGFGGVLAGFRSFIMRGNIVDLAVGVVIGVAFNALVNQFTGDFIQPLIKVVSGGNMLAGTFTIRHQVFQWANFVNGVINFVLVAAVLYFAVVTPMNKLARRGQVGDAVVAPATNAEEVVLLTEIRDALLVAAPAPTTSAPTVPDAAPVAVERIPADSDVAPVAAERVSVATDVAPVTPDAVPAAPGAEPVAPAPRTPTTRRRTTATKAVTSEAATAAESDAGAEPVPADGEAAPTTAPRARRGGRRAADDTTPPGR